MTPNGPYSKTTLVEGQCPTAINPSYAGIVDYDTDQYGIEHLVSLLLVKN